MRKKKQLEFWPDLPTVIDPRKRYERYWTYITKSPRWKAIAEKTKRLAKYQCIYCDPTCQGTINLQAHHRNYDNLYRETPGVDVECVCGNCHEYITFPQADNDNEPGSWGDLVLSSDEIESDGATLLRIRRRFWKWDLSHS